MTRYTKVNGFYVIKGKKFEMLVGSRAQVVHGTAYKTTGELKKDDLIQNKSGRIVSKKKHHTAKKENRLVKAGFGTRKGKFGFVKIGTTTRSSRKGSRKSKKGGYYKYAYPNIHPLSPAEANATTITGQK